MREGPTLKAICATSALVPRDSSQTEIGGPVESCERQGTDHEELAALLPDVQALNDSKYQDTMAEWLRRQIRISSAICFPMGAQVQILLVSYFFIFFSPSVSLKKVPVTTKVGVSILLNWPGVLDVL